MKDYLTNLAKALLGKPYDELTAREQTVINAIAEGDAVAVNTNRQYDAQATFGQRLADRVAEFGGSWTFILLFAFIIASWIATNSVFLGRNDSSFDPYPYILLNLVLSTLAAIQAPILMMSQNRQSAKDRLAAGNAFEVALKTELAIQQLHEKLDTGAVQTGA